MFLMHKFHVARTRVKTLDFPEIFVSKEEHPLHTVFPLRQKFA